jgi:transglutaminase-like putative cysteine protease
MFGWGIDGWLSVDITHRQIAGDRHCRLSVGRDYLDAAPIRGVRQGGGCESMEVSVVVATSQQEQQQQRRSKTWRSTREALPSRLSKMRDDP